MPNVIGSVLGLAKSCFTDPALPGGAQVERDDCVFELTAAALSAYNNQGGPTRPLNRTSWSSTTSSVASQIGNADSEVFPINVGAILESTLPLDDGICAPGQSEAPLQAASNSP